ncbi:MAG TPA: GGDEF domain-containing protein [Desulfurivibrionaceae bacterium]|nr:GGDEF domain-containing protein [Desulfurivibrionaceae bacterium]
MNAAISITEDLQPAVSVDHLLVQLDHYRKQTEWLAVANRLHARLAGATDLQSMIEAFSVWLMPLVDHDLIAYRNACGTREHLLCSCHGPERRKVLHVAAELFNGPAPVPGQECQRHDDFFGFRWQLKCNGDIGQVMVLRRTKALETEEIELLGKAMEILAEPLQRALDYEDLFDQARRDVLTGLENRRVFEDRIGPMLESAKRHGHPITLASMDLDRFKQINDTLGHAEGDKALRKVAQLLAAMVRTSDLLVRMGGDEFVLVLPNTDKHAAKVLAERLCRAVDNMCIGNSKSGKLGISIGLVQWRSEMSLDSWLLKADEVLYQAKAAGRCRVCVAA